MTRNRDKLSRLATASPWLTLAALLGMSIALPNRSEIRPEAKARKAEIIRSMAEAPFFIGRWVGEDATHQVPREAQTLLHPNAMLSRTYRSPSGPALQVLIVHCGDARDMIGHYPPICYPSAGWLAVPVQGSTDLALSVNGRTLPARQYHFQWAAPRGRIETVRVFNAFILPDGRVGLDIDDIHRQSERLALSAQGVAQLQVITSAATPLREAIEAASEVLGGMREVFDALRLGRADAAPHSPTADGRKGRTPPVERSSDQGGDSHA